VPALATAVGADFDLQEFAVGGAWKGRERLTAVGAVLLVGRQLQIVDDDG
jgi:hypothetical protein